MPPPGAVQTLRRGRCGSGPRPSVEADGVLQLLEEALRHLLGLARQPADFAQQRLLLGREVLRDHDLDDHELVAPAAAADVGHALALEPEGLPVLGPGRDRDLDRAVQRRDLDPIAKRRLDQVHPQLVDDVLLAPLQLRVLLDAQHDVEVARRSAPIAGLPLPAEADLGARVDAGRDLQLQPLCLLHPALATALSARLLEDAALAPAVVAGDDVDDLAEDRLGGAADLPRAAADRASVGAAPRLGARARAAIAADQAGHVDLLLGARVRLVEADAEVVAEVVAPDDPLALARPGAGGAAEEAVEDVAEAEALEAAEG